MASSVKDLANKLQRYSRATGTANRTAVSAAAMVYKRRLIERAERDAGPDRRLSRWKRRNTSRGSGLSPRLGAGYDLFGFDNAKARLRPRPYGIWALLEGGAQPHKITPYSRSRKKAKGRALKVGSQGFFANVNHPGTKPKYTFTAAIRGGEQEAMQAFAASHRKSLIESFKG